MRQGTTMKRNVKSIERMFAGFRLAKTTSVIFTCFLTGIFVIFPQATSLKVFSFQADAWRPPSTEVYLKFHLGQSGRFRKDSTSEITSCYRFRNTGFAREEVHLSYALPGIANAFLIYREGSSLNVVLNNTKLDGLSLYKLPLMLNVWTHYCFVLTLGSFALYVGGEVRVRGNHSFPLNHLSLDGMLVLGQEQDAFGSGFAPGEMFLGDLAQMDIFSRVLSQEEITNLASCRSELSGDVFSLDVDEMQNVGVMENISSLKDLCVEEETVIVYTYPLNFPESVEFCEIFSGQIYAPSSCESNEVFYDKIEIFSKECLNSFWVGISDERREGVWEEVGNLSLAPDCFSFPPNGEREENCAAVRLESGLWDDKSCIHPLRCFSCLTLRPFLLRGLCFDTPEKMLFELKGYKNERAYFQGLYGFIIYAGEEGEWIFTDIHNNRSIAKLRIAEGHGYPIGHRQWTITNKICDFSRGEKAHLSLSSCSHSDIVCSDGSCVPRTARCDGKYQCHDLSDENDCQIIRIPAGYRRQLTPGPREDGSPDQLILTLGFLRFLGIEDTKFAVTTEFTLKAEWMDRRLTFENLVENEGANKVAEEVHDKLWLPTVKFTNILDGNVKELHKDLFVKRHGHPAVRNYNDAGMDIVYTGGAATLVQTLHISGVFECTFDMYNYPFDTQKCSVKFIISSGENVQVPPNGTQVEYVGPRALPAFLIGNFGVERVVGETGDGEFQVFFSLMRRPTLLVIKLFIPSFMLLVIGYVTLYIPRDLLQARLVVSLTTLLVLYTLFSQASSSLPNTAYIKLIDIWFFFCICTLFFIILFHVFNEFLPERANLTAKVGSSEMYCDKSLRRWGLSAERSLIFVRFFLIPGGTVVFLGVYWSQLMQS